MRSTPPRHRLIPVTNTATPRGRKRKEYQDCDGEASSLPSRMIATYFWTASTISPLFPDLGVAADTSSPAMPRASAPARSNSGHHSVADLAHGECTPSIHYSRKKGSGRCATRPVSAYGSPQTSPGRFLRLTLGGLPVGGENSRSSRSPDKRLVFLPVIQNTL